MRLLIGTCLLVFIFSNSALAEQKNKTENLKEDAIYIQALPETTANWGKATLLQSQNIKIFEIPTDLLNGALLQFDKVFEKFEGTSKSSKIKEIDLGISVSAEGKIVVVNAGTTASIKIILEHK